MPKCVHVLALCAVPLALLEGVACGGGDRSDEAGAIDASVDASGGTIGSAGTAGAPTVAGSGGNPGTGGATSAGGVAAMAGSGGVADGGAGGPNDSGHEGIVDDGAACVVPDAATELPAAYCAKVSELPCFAGLDVPGCTQYIEDGLVESEARGCLCPSLVALACAVDQGLLCPAPEIGNVRVVPSCASVQDAAQRCMGVGDACERTLATTLLACAVACDQYAADCTRSSTGTPWSCTCSYGEKLGATFIAASCDEPSIAEGCR